MASVSVSELVLFIAALTVAAGVATTLTASVSDISQVVSERGSGVADQIATDVEIISDPGSPSSIYDDAGRGNVTVLVKNTGGTTLPADPDVIEFLVNGTYTRVSNVSVVGTDTWSEGEVATVTAQRSLPPGEHRVVVIVEGDRETLRFRVP